MNKHLLLTPTNIKPHTTTSTEAWFYEDNSGLTIVIDGIGQYRIPWRRLRAALARKDRKE